jgi:acyl carrier protein
LGVQRVGVHDNFFELGGHSLLAVNLMARIGQQFGKKLPLSTLFQGPTIEKLATIVNQSTEKMWSSLVAIQPNGTKQPFFCVPGIGGNVTDFYELAQQLGKDQPFYGLQAVGLDGKSKPYTNIEDMATHYLKEIQTVQPQGPYLLGGHS